MIYVPKLTGSNQKPAISTTNTRIRYEMRQIYMFLRKQSYMEITYLYNKKIMFCQ